MDDGEAAFGKMYNKSLQSTRCVESTRVVSVFCDTTFVVFAVCGSNPQN